MRREVFCEELSGYGEGEAVIERPHVRRQALFEFGVSTGSVGEMSQIGAFRSDPLDKGECLIYGEMRKVFRCPTQGIDDKHTYTFKFV